MKVTPNTPYVLCKSEFKRIRESVRAEQAKMQNKHKHNK